MRDGNHCHHSLPNMALVKNLNIKMEMREEKPKTNLKRNYPPKTKHNPKTR